MKLTMKSCGDASFMILCNLLFLLIMSLEKISFKMAVIDGLAKNMVGVYISFMVFYSVLEGDYNFFNKRIERNLLYKTFLKSYSLWTWIIMLVFIRIVQVYKLDIYYLIIIGLYIFLCFLLFYSQKLYLKKLKLFTDNSNNAKESGDA